MITGYRWHFRGAQYFYNIQPDLTTFGKAMANGFAVAALGGRREVMEIGGILDEGKERVFLTSTTHGAEMGALGAFLKTSEILKRENVIDHIWDYGRKLKVGIKDIVAEAGLQGLFDIEGYPCSPSYTARDANGAVSLPLRTLFAQEMIKENVMMPYIALSYAHGEKELETTLCAVKSALKTYKKAVDGDVSKFLNGRPIKPVFRKFN
jgi:glutamate-1-semialdehyde 2,1-aminomutase